jgi:hypothetical protein
VFNLSNKLPLNEYISLKPIAPLPFVPQQTNRRNSSHPS